METILYITGGIALLALAWLFISLVKALKVAHEMMIQLETDVHTAVVAAEEIRAGIMPILGNVTHITANVSKITAGVQNQMVGVHETIDDALDIVRGSLDDVERLKNNVVATVEGPLLLARETANGAIGAVSTALRVANVILKLAGNRKKKSSMNGRG